LSAKRDAIALGFQAYEVANQLLNLACCCSTEVLLSFALDHTVEKGFDTGWSNYDNFWSGQSDEQPTQAFASV